MGRLLIISDLYGYQDCHWIDMYINQLESSFSIKLIDAPEIAEVDSSSKEKSIMHQQFLQYGINHAVTKLKDMIDKEDTILGFSIGGYLAYLALTKGAVAKQLIAISPTRVRQEERSPACATHLIFGQQDPFIPSESWLKKSPCTITIKQDAGHELYKETKHAFTICQALAAKSSHRC